MINVCKAHGKREFYNILWLKSFAESIREGGGGVSKTLAQEHLILHFPRILNSNLTLLYVLLG